MSENYDLAILGAGPGGYVAAIHAAKLGMKVAIIEKDRLGGVCLNKGCIPTKTFLRSAELYHYQKNGQEFGINSSSISFDMDLLQKRKHKIIEQLFKGVQFLLKSQKISIYQGKGRILGPSIFSPIPGAISIEPADGSESKIITPKYVMIATGSRPKHLPTFNIDGINILDSDSALQMEELPKSMIIVGGGVIGVEWASLLSDFGVSVTLLEQADRILPTEDSDISKEMNRVLKKRKVKIITSVNVLQGKSHDSGVLAYYNDGNNTESISADKMIVSVGRQANVEDIGLTNTSIKLDRGVIVTNQFMQTNESHIYAVGDVVGGYQLAHVASAEGVLAVDHMLGKSPLPINEQNIPRAIYSRPEVGSIGWSEQEAINKGYEVKVSKIPSRASGKALIYGEVDGFVKVVADAQSNDLLGVHIIGAHATELISEASLARFLDATPWELSHSIRPHPTLSELLGDAVLDLK